MTLPTLPNTLTPKQIEAILLPGDCLLYAPSGIYGRLIAIKTWANVSHVELYSGNGRSTASRDGIGVGSYPLRTDHLAYILRPAHAALLDWASFWKWFRTVNGQKYDWLGLLRFVWTHEIPQGHNDKMFCSEYVCRAYRALGVDVFNPAEDADAIAPASFLLSPVLTPVLASGALSVPQDAA